MHPYHGTGYRLEIYGKDGTLAMVGGTRIEADFDHAVRRHRMLDAIVRSSETGQRQKVAL